MSPSKSLLHVRDHRECGRKCGVACLGVGVIDSKYTSRTCPRCGTTWDVRNGELDCVHGMFGHGLDCCLKAMVSYHDHAAQSEANRAQYGRRKCFVSGLLAFGDLLDIDL